MTLSNNITYWSATGISYILWMRILRGITKFSKLSQIIIQLERGRGGIEKQADLLNIYVYILLNSVQLTLNLLWPNKKMNGDNSIFISALPVYFSTSLSIFRNTLWK